MSANSGIGISKELSDTFAAAVESNSVRFIKVGIEKESIVSNGTTNAIGATLEDDLEKLQSLLEDNVPAYVLARIGGPNGWLAITYVPDTANVRDKMLYASTRASLTKSLGSTHFTDSLFATTKSDLTPQSYAAHKAHTSAPQPLSAREQELADMRAAEKTSGVAYEGMQARRSHTAAGAGFGWTPDAEQAIKDLGAGSSSALVVLSVEEETLVLKSSADCKIEELAGRIPASEPSFSFYAWSHKHGPSPRRDIIFIYSCPSSSPVKNRMIYSSGALGVHRGAKPLLSSLSSTSAFVERKVETSDPAELTEAHLKSELGLDAGASASAESPSSTTRMGGEARGFARPKGPGRKR